MQFTEHIQSSSERKNTRELQGCWPPNPSVTRGPTVTLGLVLPAPLVTESKEPRARGHNGGAGMGMGGGWGGDLSLVGVTARAQAEKKTDAPPKDTAVGNMMKTQPPPSQRFHGYSSTRLKILTKPTGPEREGGRRAWGTVGHDPGRGSPTTDPHHAGSSDAWAC